MIDRRWLRIFAVLVLIVCPVSIGQAQITLGVVGDSLSDEYAEGNYDYALNWVEQLSAYGVADVGPTAAAAGVGDWGEPRRTGFQYNWALSGADSETLLTQGQHTGLASQVAPEGITHIVLAIGANDFFPLGSNYLGLYSGTMTAEEIEDVIDGIVANIDTGLQTLKTTDADIVMGNVPDYGITPIVRSFLPDPVKRERVTTVIRQLNDRLEDLALANDVPLVDVLGATKAIFGEHSAARTTILVGNVPLLLLESDDIQNTNPTAAFVHDGVHPHTAVQGVLANILMEAFNLGYGDNIPLFTEEEILAHAGIPYGGEDTLMGELGVNGYEAFIIIPEPSTIGMLVSGGLVLLIVGRRFRQRFASGTMSRGKAGGLPASGIRGEPCDHLRLRRAMACVLRTARPCR